jgi:protein required for attachment to host cells
VVEQRFVEHLADLLEDGFDANEFRRLVLVAPARLLGRLRRAISPPVARCVIGTQAKVLVRLSPDDLRPRLDALLSADS